MYQSQRGRVAVQEVRTLRSLAKWYTPKCLGRLTFALVCAGRSLRKQASASGAQQKSTGYAAVLGGLLAVVSAAA